MDTGGRAKNGGGSRHNCTHQATNYRKGMGRTNMHALAPGALLGAGGAALGAGPQLGPDLLAGPLQRGGLLLIPLGRHRVGGGEARSVDDEVARGGAPQHQRHGWAKPPPWLPTVPHLKPRSRSQPPGPAQPCQHMPTPVDAPPATLSSLFLPPLLPSLSLSSSLSPIAGTNPWRCIIHIMS